MPQEKTKFKYENLPNEKSEDTLLANLFDRVEDSVKGYYEEFRHSLFCEMLADRIADRNYPLIDDNQADAFDNLLAKNLYNELLSGGNENFVHIDAPKICDKIKRIKMAQQ